jgi:ribosomal protein L11 methylase PrmA
VNLGSDAPYLLVVAAAKSDDAPAAATALEASGADEVTVNDVGRGRVLVYGGPFAPVDAAATAARLRGLGWPADVRPSGGGHLAAWHAHTAPTVIDERLWVCLPWSEFDRDAAGPIVEIDPGQAFGTGAHPSTRLVLEQLVGRLDGHQSVLDVGCGSGVLAITAAALGCRRVVAVDVQPEAVARTLENATRNSVTIDASLTAVAAIDEVFDVVVANMSATTLVELAPAIGKRVAPGGWLAVSGISSAQTSVVAAAYVGMRVIETFTRDEWSAVVLQIN